MKERFFLLDIGNTKSRCGLLEDGSFKYVFNKSTKELSLQDIPEDVVVAAACVVPGIREKFKARDIYFVSHLSNSGIDLSLIDGSTLGADRLANLAALASFYTLPAAIIDSGTGLTLEVLDKNRTFIGGVIAPGRELQRRALNTYTALLPYVPVKEDDEKRRTFGRTTEDSIILGTDYGVIGAVKEFMALTKRESNMENVKFFVTGGDADMLSKHIPELTILSPNFTLLGVFEIWKRSVGFSRR